MTTKRFKDTEWGIPIGPNGCVSSIEGAQLAVMMDIRDELKRLNRLLHCQNFLLIPAKLDGIRRNTTRKPRKVKA